jgi:hypothetical protein
MSLATQALYGKTYGQHMDPGLGHGFNSYVAVYQMVLFGVYPAGWWFGT